MPLIKIGTGMVNTADTCENSDEFSLRVCLSYRPCGPVNSSHAGSDFDEAALMP